MDSQTEDNVKVAFTDEVRDCAYYFTVCLPLKKKCICVHIIVRYELQQNTLKLVALNLHYSEAVAEAQQG